MANVPRQGEVDGNHGYWASDFTSVNPRFGTLEELQALVKAEQDKFMGTDEAMLVERTGHRVKVIEGSPINIKVTTPEDLEWAKLILNRGKKL